MIVPATATCGPLDVALIVVVAPPVIVGAPVVVQERPAVVVEEGPPPVRVPPSRPDPVVYPRNGQSAQSRSMAGIMSNSITDAMRANVTEARNGAYNGSTCDVSGEPGGSLADSDITAWVNSLKRAIGQTACGTVLCQSGQCDITVQWNDARASAGSSTHQVTTRVQL